MERLSNSGNSVFNSLLQLEPSFRADRIQIAAAAAAIVSARWCLIRTLKERWKFHDLLKCNCINLTMQVWMKVIPLSSEHFKEWSALERMTFCHIKVIEDRKLIWRSISSRWIDPSKCSLESGFGLMFKFKVSRSIHPFQSWINLDLILNKSWINTEFSSQHRSADNRALHQ